VISALISAITISSPYTTIVCVLVPLLAHSLT